MRRWKKSRALKGILLVILAVSILADVLSGMYMMIGRDYARLDKEKERDFFVSQEKTQNLLDGYIRLYEEYMQIGSLITTDGNIDYDKEILISLMDNKRYTIKELLKNSVTEGEASRKLREFMDDFEQNCEEGKSYPWVTRYILKSDMRVILEDGNIFQFNSPNAINLSNKQIKDMRKYQENMKALTTDVDSYKEDFAESITVKLSDSNKSKVKFVPKSNYEDYIVTYFPIYARYYFLKQAIRSYSSDNREKFNAVYEEYGKCNEEGNISENRFSKVLQKTCQKYEEMLTEDMIPWKAHVLPRTMEEAAKYVTFLVETYQEMKYLFSRSNFFFAYENSQNLLITNNEEGWLAVKEEMGKSAQPQAAVDSDRLMYAYFNGKGYEGKSTFPEDSFLMTGNIMEKLKDIGVTFNFGTYQICVGLDLRGIRNQKYEDEFTQLYIDSHRKFALFQMGRQIFGLGMLAGLISFVLLACVCGHSRQKEGYELLWYDKIWLEIQIVIGYVFVCMALWLLKLWEGADSLVLVLVFGTIIAVLLYCCLGILLSIIKRVKMHCVGHYSIIMSFIREVIVHKMNVKDWIKEWKRRIAFFPVRRKKSLLILFEISVCLYFAGSLLFVKLDRQVTCGSFLVSPLGMIAAVLGCVFVCVLFILQRNHFRCEEVERMVIDGTKRIMKGDFEYQLPDCEEAGYREIELIDTINQIGEVLEKAVDESVRSERMKTELIANVSHDIKTPLTSVINYIDLLKRQNLQDETTQKYVDVLERKSLRLKTLIEDLVEASKASSGVMELEIHTLNFNELIRQTNGEFEDRYEEKHLELILDIPEGNLYFEGDGRRVFRILENLYNNVAKYAMENTRVYVALEQIDGNLIFSMKNVSSKKLNITPEELTERFVRGDRSRTTEGSGLGLSIAKSLTELMGGEFKIELDGDLFCAKVSFPISFY